MRRVVMSGGSNIGSRLVIAVFVIVGVLLLLFFALAAITFAVILIPVGIVIFLVSKIFLPRRRPGKDAEAGTVNAQEIKDIIDITDYEEAEDLKALSGGNKDGE